MRNKLTDSDEIYLGLGNWPGLKNLYLTRKPTREQFNVLAMLKEKFMFAEINEMYG